MTHPTQSSYLYEIRLAFAVGRGRKVTETWANHHARMAEHWVKHARDCARPAYHEARGFTTDRWGRTGRSSISGREKPYGPFSRTHWRYVWKAMRAAFLSAWHEEMDDTYDYWPDTPRAVLTGLTA